MREHTYSKLLLVVGSSAESHRAVDRAIDMALRSPGSRLFVLNIVDMATVNRMKRFSDKSATEIEVELEEDGWKLLYHVEDRAKDQGVPTMILQDSGSVDHVILKEAARLKADLIVIGYPSPASGQMKRLVSGHIEKTLENSACDVLVVK